MTQSHLLNPLVDAIEMVKGRIDVDYAHRDSLVSQEAQTRVSLIDPILVALGWDVSDPEYVRSEFSAENRRADYALMAESKPGQMRRGVAVSIEAKSLDTTLDTRANREQMVLQVNNNGATYAVLTDGDTWQVYDFTKPGQNVQERMVLTIRLSEESAYECALKFLMLWRPNVVSGQPVEANRPVAGMPSNGSQQSATGEPPVQPKPPPPEAGWVRMTDYDYSQHGSPAGARMPDGDPLAINGAAGLMRGTAEWLYDQGRFDGEDLPIRSKSGRRTLVRSDTAGMRRPHSIRDQRLYIDMNRNGKDCIEMARMLLERLGKNPAMPAYLLPSNKS